MTATEPLLLRSEVKKEEDLCLPIDVDASPADSSLYSPTTTGGLQLEVIYSCNVISPKSRTLKTDTWLTSRRMMLGQQLRETLNCFLFCFFSRVVNWRNPLISGNRRQQQQNSAAASYF